ncbi:MAG: hypothetical protein M3R51_08725 [Candidatus Eremiobacteraeota bacterium]|nr:hypothetical protein [Candidatus Eremiobacteraeota bacterium]
MRKGNRSFAAAFLIAAFVPWHAGAEPAPASERHLVYDFTYGTSSDLEIHDSGMGGSGNAGSGSTDSGASDQDKGTITVDVIGERPDGGLTIMVSEAAQGHRTALPAACVVYDNTTTVCDLGKRVNEEELAIARLLGPHFFDPSRVDAKQHWNVTNSSNGFSERSDFSVSKNDGGMLTIAESGTATQSGMPKIDTSVSATIRYDSNLQVPVNVSEYSVAREQQSIDQHETQTSQMSASLVSDSMAKKN